MRFVCGMCLLLILIVSGWAAFPLGCDLPFGVMGLVYSLNLFKFFFVYCYYFGCYLVFGGFAVCFVSDWLTGLVWCARR